MGTNEPKASTRKKISCCYDDSGSSCDLRTVRYLPGEWKGNFVEIFIWVSWCIFGSILEVHNWDVYFIVEYNEVPSKDLLESYLGVCWGVCWGICIGGISLGIRQSFQLATVCKPVGGVLWRIGLWGSLVSQHIWLILGMLNLRKGRNKVDFISFFIFFIII